MPNIDFPNSPTVNQQFTAGGKIWQWSGTTWDVVRIAVPAASLTSTDVSRLTGATSNLQTQINTLSTNLGNTLDDYVPIGDVGVADGVASLDSAGKIPIAQLGNLIDGAPGALDTLNELAAAINDDASYAAGITTALGTKVSNAGGDIITSSLASTIPLRIRGAASQTANLQEWQNSAGSVLVQISASGVFRSTYNYMSYIQNMSGSSNAYLDLSTGNTVKVVGAAAYVPLTVQGAASQTANLQEWQNSAGTVTARFTKDGEFFVTDAYVAYFSGASNYSATLNVQTADPTYAGLVIRGKSAQTGDLQKWQNSAGNVLANVDSTGKISSPVFQSTVAGTAYIATASNNNAIRIATNGNANVGLSIRGEASQTGNLQEWQNSAGTVLAKITASGALDATAITVNGAAISGGGLSPVAVSTNITMVANTRYFVDTASARILTLPATPALGAEIELYDASNNAFTNNVSILRNGQKINGLTDDAALDINGFAVSFIYTGSTYGWRIK
jgi:hypothetical protein